MSAPLAHPLQGAPLPAAISDARLDNALRVLAQIMEAHPGAIRDAALPVFDRLEAEYDARQKRNQKHRRFL